MIRYIAYLNFAQVVEGLLQRTLGQLLECFAVFSLGTLHRIQRLNLRLRQRVRLDIAFVETQGQMVSVEVLLGYACNLLLGQCLNLGVRGEDALLVDAICEAVNQFLHLGRRRFKLGLV